MGKHAWEVAPSSPITEKNAKEATIHALSDLDASFFRVRFDQLTSMQKQYLRALATLGAGSHGSGEVAKQMDKRVTDLGPVRDQLISKGVIYSPAHGKTAFTVPLFDAFMRRIMQ
ncbi:hypothetical protein [Coxiella burnetii]|uniref:hypothetical protein n=1 Tax=Coxiella burnetii TaxID=777 RepID=UPI0002EA1DD6|nr:hypothetical protein [Coxiella burnetii]